MTGALEEGTFFLIKRNMGEHGENMERRPAGGAGGEGWREVRRTGGGGVLEQQKKNCQQLVQSRHFLHADFLFGTARPMRAIFPNKALT